MRGFIRLAACMILLCLLPCAALSESALYLRVVAADGSNAALRQKLRVRDAVLSVCPRDPRLLPAALPAIQKAAVAAGPCAVTLRHWAPMKNAPALPTLYIEVGQAQGQNWFGLLYEDTPLLFSDGGEGDVQFIWPVFEWFRRLFSR